MKDEQSITQGLLTTFQANVEKYNDIIAIREGASLEELHPEMTTTELSEYGDSLEQFAQRHLT